MRSTRTSPATPACSACRPIRSTGARRRCRCSTFTQRCATSARRSRTDRTICDRRHDREDARQAHDALRRRLSRASTPTAAPTPTRAAATSSPGCTAAPISPTFCSACRSRRPCSSAPASSSSDRTPGICSCRTTGARSRQLTINAGLRYEYYSPLSEAANRLVTLDAVAGLHGRGAGDRRRHESVLRRAARHDRPTVPHRLRAARRHRVEAAAGDHRPHRLRHQLQRERLSVDRAAAWRRSRRSRSPNTVLATPRRRCRSKRR